MGLFFSARSWRAPLQLIDCWLPEPGAASLARQHAQGSMPIRPATGQTSATVQRFARAGWLGRPAANAPRLDDPTDPHGGPASASQPGGAVQTGQQRGQQKGQHTAQRTAARRGAGARLVLSGRMDQVCAELERLAAQEEALQRAA